MNENSQRVRNGLLKRPIVVVLAGLIGIVATVFLLWPQRPGLKMSVVAVQRGELATWYATLLLTNELDAHLGFEWLDAEDRDLSDKHAERLLFYDFNSAPSTIGPHESLTYARRLPPPGTARRFRLLYHRLGQEEFRLKRMIRHLYSRDEWKPGGQVAVSPEASADDTTRQ